MTSLRRLNLAAGALHAVSLVAVLALANDFSLPVTATYLTGPPGSSYSAPVPLFDIRVAISIAVFLGLSALFHVIVASPTFFSRYQSSLLQNRNIFRWVEYSLSSSVMVVVIAQLNGITEFTALVAIFAINVSMILFGWLMEVANKPGERVWWTPFWFGCTAGVAPWLGLLSYLVLAEGGEGPPGFVYGILVSIFVFFNCFAIVQWLQYRKVGRWADYLVGERSYIALSFVAKSALAWQIFANTLID
jgi:hypothetical protein